MLLAFACRHPAVGYTQALNFLCAMLLLHLDEEEAFWLLSTLVEDIMPDSMYSSSMGGLHQECGLFSELVALKLPKLHATAAFFFFFGKRMVTAKNLSIDIRSNN